MAKHAKTAEKTEKHNGHTRCGQLPMLFRVKCLYFEIFIDVNRPYFVPQNIPYYMLDFAPSPTTRDIFIN